MPKYPDIPGGYPPSEIDKIRKEEEMLSLDDVVDMQAGDEFRNSLIPRSDASQGDCPLWFGWAIMDAFLAGAKHARNQKPE